MRWHDFGISIHLLTAFSGETYTAPDHSAINLAICSKNNGVERKKQRERLSKKKSPPGLQRERPTEKTCRPRHPPETLLGSSLTNPRVVPLSCKGSSTRTSSFFLRETKRSIHEVHRRHEEEEEEEEKEEEKEQEEGRLFLHLGLRIPRRMITAETYR